ncbi:MAG TPA: helix-turn-helix domain-containing protein [Rubricoccaceae bacterium]|jgi:AraC-like DNA-binding protein
MPLPLDALVSSLLSAGAILAGLAVGVGLLVRRAGDRRAQVWLGALLLLTAATFGNSLLCEVGVCSAYEQLYFLPLDFSLAIGPLVYLYVRERVRPGLAARDAVHAVLPLAQVAFWASVGFRSVAFKAWLWQAVVSPVLGPATGVLFVVVSGGYVWAALRLVRPAPNAPEWARARARWLGRFLRTAAVLFIVLTAYEVADAVLGFGAGINPYNWPWYAFPKHVAYVGVLVTFALHGWDQLHPARWMPPAPAPRVATYGLTADALAAEARRVRAAVEAERPYRNPDLTLGLLADALGMPDKTLSYVLNEGLGTAYAPYINGLRVADARQALADPAKAHLSVLAVGLEAGFSSKATFNRAFKAATGQTPSEVRRDAERATRRRPEEDVGLKTGVSFRP